MRLRIEVREIGDGMSVEPDREHELWNMSQGQKMAFLKCKQRFMLMQGQILRIGDGDH